MTAPKQPDDTAASLILASGSPRRHALLSQAGIDHEVIPPNLNEEILNEDNPVRLARALAVAKAGAVRVSTPGASQRWILAADTIVAVGDRILGKPSDRARAAAMIRELSGRTHTVVTGIAIWPPEIEKPTVRTAETIVAFAELTDEKLQHYLEMNEWKDVAGAYRIQGAAALYIDWISGSYSNVVGLPIQLVYSILTHHGYRNLGGNPGLR